VKILAALWRDPAIDHAALEEGIADWASTVLADVSVLGLTVNSATLDQGPYTRATDDLGLVPTADAVVAVWSDARWQLDGFDGLVRLGRRFAAWVVDEHRVKRAERTGPDGVVSPGVKMISLMRRRPDLSREEFARHWTERHAPLALRHHVGLRDYTQNVVIESLTSDGADVDGIAELHFATWADFTDRFFDGPDGMRIIREDVARFMTRASSDAAVFTETCWRDPAG